MAAALSGDASLIRMIRDGDDLHWKIARQVWGPGAVKANRYTAKRIVFGRLYGGGVPALAAQAGASQEQAQAAIDTLDNLTPALAAWSRQVRDQVRAGRTQFPAYTGRIVHLPADTPHKAPNYCIQGTARELLADALLRWQDTPWGSATLLPVHDEILVTVPEDQAAAALAALTAVMTTELYGVPVIAESSPPAFAWATLPDGRGAITTRGRARACRTAAAAAPRRARDRRLAAGPCFPLRGCTSGIHRTGCRRTGGPEGSASRPGMYWLPAGTSCSAVVAGAVAAPAGAGLPLYSGLGSPQPCVVQVSRYSGYGSLHFGHFTKPPLT